MMLDISATSGAAAAVGAQRRPSKLTPSPDTTSSNSGESTDASDHSLTDEERQLLNSVNSAIGNISNAKSTPPTVRTRDMSSVAKRGSKDKEKVPASKDEKAEKENKKATNSSKDQSSDISKPKTDRKSKKEASHQRMKSSGPVAPPRPSKDSIRIAPPMPPTQSVESPESDRGKGKKDSVIASTADLAVPLTQEMLPKLPSEMPSKVPAVERTIGQQLRGEDASVPRSKTTSVPKSKESSGSTKWFDWPVFGGGAPENNVAAGADFPAGDAGGKAKSKGQGEGKSKSEVNSVSKDSAKSKENKENSSPAVAAVTSDNAQAEKTTKDQSKRHSKRRSKDQFMERRAESISTTTNNNTDKLTVEPQKAMQEKEVTKKENKKENKQKSGWSRRRNGSVSAEPVAEPERLLLLPKKNNSRTSEIKNNNMAKLAAPTKQDFPVNNDNQARNRTSGRLPGPRRAGMDSGRSTATTASTARRVRRPTLTKNGLSRYSTSTLKTSRRVMLLGKQEAMFWDCPKVAQWLDLLGLSRYTTTFERNGVNGAVLLDLKRDLLIRGLEVSDEAHLRSLERGIEELRKRNIQYDKWEWTCAGVQAWLDVRGFTPLMRRFNEAAVHGGVLFNLDMDELTELVDESLYHNRHMPADRSLIVYGLWESIERAREHGRDYLHGIPDWGPDEVYAWLKIQHLAHLNDLFRAHCINGTSLLKLTLVDMSDVMMMTEIQTIVLVKAVQKLRKEEVRSLGPLGRVSRAIKSIVPRPYLDYGDAEEGLAEMESENSMK